jgi:methionyl-tRNA synthetase
MNVARLGNKYLADEEPWKVIKTIQNACKHKCMRCKLLRLSSLCEPFLPLQQKNYQEFKNRKSVELEYYCSKFDLIPAGHQIGEAELLFAKLKTKKFKNK